MVRCSFDCSNWWEKLCTFNSSPFLKDNSATYVDDFYFISHQLGLWSLFSHCYCPLNTHIPVWLFGSLFGWKGYICKNIQIKLGISWVNRDLSLQTLGSCLFLDSPLAVITMWSAFEDEINNLSRLSVLLHFDEMLCYCKWLSFWEP